MDCKLLCIQLYIPDSTSPFGCYRDYNTLWNLYRTFEFGSKTFLSSVSKIHPACVYWRTSVTPAQRMDSGPNLEVFLNSIIIYTISPSAQARYQMLVSNTVLVEPTTKYFCKKKSSSYHSNCFSNCHVAI